MCIFTSFCLAVCVKVENNISNMVKVIRARKLMPQSQIYIVLFLTLITNYFITFLYIYLL